MKTLNKVGVVSAANVVGILGALTGVIKVAVLPVLAIIAAGNLGDLDTALNTIGVTASKSVGDVLTFGVGGWLTGAVYASLLNLTLSWTKGLKVEGK